jgi:hypothetical protein
MNSCGVRPLSVFSRWLPLRPAQTRNPMALQMATKGRARQSGTVGGRVKVSFESLADSYQPPRVAQGLHFCFLLGSPPPSCAFSSQSASTRQPILSMTEPSRRRVLHGQLDTNLFDSEYFTPAMASPTFNASAAIVRPVFTAPADGNTDASTTKRRSISCTLQLWSRTENRGSVPNTTVPVGW